MIRPQPTEILSRQLAEPSDAVARLREGSPLISLVLGLKNGLPYVERTIAALRRQTYKKFELIIQDGGSTDGSLQYVRSIHDLTNVRLNSQPDTGIGQAYNRGIARCRGDIVAFISSDEYFYDDALEKSVSWFRKQPHAVAVYGSVRLIDAQHRTVQIFFPPPFELDGVLRNEIVPPMGATFLNRAGIGSQLYYDETLKTCPDYDLWLRLGRAFGTDAIVGVPEPVTVALADRSSMTYRAESFAQFCEDKLTALNRYLSASEDIGAGSEIWKRGAAGIFMWAAEGVFALEGASPLFLQWCEKAAALDPASARLLSLARKSLSFDVEPLSGEFTLRANIQPVVPAASAESADESVRLGEIHSSRHWKGARVQTEPMLRVVTGEEPWAYAAQIPLLFDEGVDASRWYWARLSVSVLSGQIGIAMLVDDVLLDEHLVGIVDGQRDVYLRVGSPLAKAIVIRNASMAESSVLEILDARIEWTYATTSDRSVTRRT